MMRILSAATLAAAAATAAPVKTKFSEVRAPAAPSHRHRPRRALLATSNARAPG
eukprot:SAG22_NODE_288_length_12949_cov_163.316265_16_plen_54_part_00